LIQALSTSNSRYIVKIIKFIIILGLIIVSAWILANQLDDDVNHIKSLWHDIYALENNSVDIVFLGSSHANSSFDTEVFYNITGNTSFNLGSSSQTPANGYHILREFLKRQNPRILVQEIYWDVMTEDIEVSAVNSQHLTYMRPGANGAAIFFNTLSPKEKETFIMKGLNPFYRLKGITIRKLSSRSEVVEDFQTIQYKGRGFRPYMITANGDRINEVIERLNNFSGYSEEQIAYLQRTIDLAQSRGMKVILVMAPIMPEVFNGLSCYDEVEQVSREIARDNNIDYIDFNILIKNKEINIPSDYFGDEHHVNYKGAIILSTYLAKYIKSNGILDE